MSVSPLVLSYLKQAASLASKPAARGEVGGRDFPEAPLARHDVSSLKSHYRGGGGALEL